MAYNYIYIDDIQNQLEKGIITGIEYGGEIKIDFRKPDNWEQQIVELKKILPTKDGIILDLRLNDNPNDKGIHAQYRGPAVAQELRTLVKEKVIANDFPIILISANEKIEQSLDETSLDLFDACVRKDTLGAEGKLSYPRFRQKLICLSSGYKFLNEADKNIICIFNITDPSILDSRFVDFFNAILMQPNHVIARCIIKQVLEKPSFLIDECFLSARLGVNRDSKDWLELCHKILEGCKYTGIFSGYYSRWWMPLIEVFWETKISSEISLRGSSAGQRVALLKEKLNLQNIIPLGKIEKGKSDSFWTVCKATKKAIDTIDGLLIAGQDNNHSWQEKEFVSIEEALRPTKIDEWKSISTLEKNRLQKLITFYDKKESGRRK